MLTIFKSKAFLGIQHQDTVLRRCLPPKRCICQKEFSTGTSKRGMPGAPHPILEASRLIFTSLNLERHPRGNGKGDVGYGTPGPPCRGSPASRRRLNVLPSLRSSTSVTGTDKQRATTVAKVNRTLQRNKSGTLQASSDTGHRV